MSLDSDNNNDDEQSIQSSHIPQEVIVMDTVLTCMQTIISHTKDLNMKIKQFIDVVDDLNRRICPLQQTDTKVVNEIRPHLDNEPQPTASPKEGEHEEEATHKEC